VEEERVVEVETQTTVLEPGEAQVTAEALDSVPPASTETPAAVSEAGTTEAIPAAPVSDTIPDADTPADAPPLPPKPDAHDEQEESMTFIESWLRIPIVTPAAATTQVKEIEEDIIAELVRRHAVWIDGAGQ
jgi:phosphopantothenate-cysteine ligase